MSVCTLSLRAPFTEDLQHGWYGVAHRATAIGFVNQGAGSQCVGSWNSMGGGVNNERLPPALSSLSTARPRSHTALSTPNILHGWGCKLEQVVFRRHLAYSEDTIGDEPHSTRIRQPRPACAIQLVPAQAIAQTAQRGYSLHSSRYTIALAAQAVAPCMQLRL